MADSLRDQLIAAGFDAPKKKPDTKAGNRNGPGKKSPGNKRSGNKSQGRKRPNQGGDKHRQGGPSKAKHHGSDNRSDNKGAQAKTKEAEELALERKKLKAQIKELIDNNQLKDWKGEVTYRYLVDKRIRELYVNEAAHKQLADREVAITRLNGDTYLVPLAIATQIKQVNPQWSVFNTDNDTDNTTSGDEEYAQFQVPDDLQW